MSATPAPPVSSLYVHVPFCAHKCPYCAFFSEPAPSSIIQNFVDALVCELELVAPDLEPETIFFGGGTPSLLSVGQWAQIFRTFDRLRLLGAGEWTIECNPATVSMEKARLWRDHGVNRISLGVQSFEPALLERLGRIHTRAMAIETFELLRQTGFDNVNIDLMFAIPGQTLEQWGTTLREALRLEPEHLSCYELTFEEDTQFFEQLQAGRFAVDEDLACAMYDELLELTAGAGLIQYEVSNFARCPSKNAARPDFACRHNLNYWRGLPYYGLGPSAASYVADIRTKNWSDAGLYCQCLAKGERPIESREELPPLKRAGETAAFGLRMTAGWPLAEFKERTGFDLCVEWKEELKQLVAQGWGELNSQQFRLTRQGLRFADAAARLFLR